MEEHILLISGIVIFVFGLFVLPFACIICFDVLPKISKNRRSNNNRRIRDEQRRVEKNIKIT